MQTQQGQARQERMRPLDLALGQATVAATGNIVLTGAERTWRRAAALALARDARRQGWEVRVHTHGGEDLNQWIRDLADPSAVSFWPLSPLQDPSAHPRLVIVDRDLDAFEPCLVDSIVSDPNVAALFVPESAANAALVRDFSRVRILTGTCDPQAARRLLGAEHLELEAVGAGQALVMDTDLDAVMQTSL